MQGNLTMDRDQLALAALAAAGENVTFSPVQVQKLFFLIDRKVAHLVGGPHFNFQPYDYGPFDQQVYGTLDGLALNGFVLKQSTGRYRNYALTPDGYRNGVANLKLLPSQAVSYLTRLTAWIRDLNFQQLVSTIYREYPDMKVNSVFKE